MLWGGVTNAIGYRCAMAFLAVGSTLSVLAIMLAICCRKTAPPRSVALAPRIEGVVSPVPLFPSLLPTPTPVPDSCKKCGRIPPPPRPERGASPPPSCHEQKGEERKSDNAGMPPAEMAFYLSFSASTPCPSTVEIARKKGRAVSAVDNMLARYGTRSSRQEYLTQQGLQLEVIEGTQEVIGMAVCHGEVHFPLGHDARILYQYRGADRDNRGTFFAIFNKPSQGFAQINLADFIIEGGINEASYLSCIESGRKEGDVSVVWAHKEYSMLHLGSTDPDMQILTYDSTNHYALLEIGKLHRYDAREGREPVYFVLASASFWKVMPYQLVTGYLCHMHLFRIQSHLKPIDPQYMAGHLADIALERENRDDMNVIVIYH